MNIFLKKFENKSEQELTEIVDNPSKYNPEAVKAARDLLSGDVSQSDNDETKYQIIEFPAQDDSMPQFKYLAYFFLFIAFVVLFSNLVLAIIIFAIVVVLLYYFSPSTVQLDLNDRSIRFDGSISYFDQVDRLILRSAKVSQSMTSNGGAVNTIRYRVYQAYLHSKDKKYLLGESRKKEKVLDKLSVVSGLIDIPVEDFS